MKTILTIESNNGFNTYYFDQDENSLSVELHKDEKFIKSFDHLADAINYFLVHYKVSDLKVTGYSNF